MDAVAAARSLALNLILFLSLEVSHHLGGGDYSLPVIVFPIFIFSFLFLWARPVKDLRGPHLLSLLVLFQVVGHIALTSNQSIATSQMSFAHLTGVGAGYFVAANFDQSILSLVELLASCFIPLHFILPKLVRQLESTFFTRRTSEFLTNYFCGLSKRGPPQCAIKWA